MIIKIKKRVLQYKKLKTTIITTTRKIMVWYLVIAFKKQRKIWWVYAIRVVKEIVKVGCKNK